jgi:DNA-binding NarL/FixJ family response regulator
LSSSSDSAVRAAVAHRPHVALVDYRLGADNGIAAARRLLEIDPALTIIITTADPDPVVEEARQAGCWGCIEKSVGMGRDLPGLLRTIINGKDSLPS